MSRRTTSRIYSVAPDVYVKIERENTPTRGVFWSLREWTTGTLLTAEALFPQILAVKNRMAAREEPELMALARAATAKGEAR